MYIVSHTNNHEQSCTLSAILNNQRSEHCQHEQPTHVHVPEESRNKTAFWSGNKLYRWTRMPFGLAGSPAFFQSVIDHSLTDLLDSKGQPFTAVFLDDIAVFSDTVFSENLERINIVLQRLQDRFGQRCVHPDKSIFISQRVHYPGYILTTGGTLSPQAAKIQAFMDLPTPTNHNNQTTGKPHPKNQETTRSGAKLI
jgi:hypothetical protein